ncbi:MAG: LysM peptidoglycan-binding domain-containing protein [Deltaproteobacteria bacterium]|nr:LysM peptidoglycan-binding domain-containing protein [Deltaproteobacteria bacterium]
MKIVTQSKRSPINGFGIALLISLILALGCAQKAQQTTSEPVVPKTAQMLDAKEAESKPPVTISRDMPDRSSSAAAIQEKSGLTDQTDAQPPVRAPEANRVVPAVQSYPKSSKPLETSTAEKTDQELLDSALEFCNASTDFWNQGDLENAMDALDQAYSLILQVNPDQSPEILQQRDDLRITISKKIIQVYASRFTLVNGNHHAIPLIINADVKHAIKLLQGRERKFFLRAYRRSGEYRPMMVRKLKEAGLPESLSWLPLIESGYKVRALSRARALGMWQFIASTGYKYGLERDRWVDERMDPEKSTDAAIAYLKELHQIFGDWLTVLAAYNCGEGRVLRCIKTQRIDYLDHFWDLYSKLPRETAFYVPKFLAVLHIINDPKAYGFTLPPVDKAIKTDTVTVGKPMHIKTIAKTIGVPYDELKDLNPALRYYTTPDRPYNFRVPEGKGPLLVAKLDTISRYRPAYPTYVTYKVRRGDNLSSIASRYRTTVRAIMEANHLRSQRHIKAGWKLKVPAGRRYVPRASQPAASPSIPERPPTRYRVKKGDSLWKIARKYGTTPKEIQSLNHLGTTRLIIGQSLKIPGSSPRAPKEGVTKRPERYRVQKGDSLWNIARRYGTTTRVIQSLNNLNSTRLSIGQVLKIPQVSASTEKIQTRSYTVLKGESPYLIARKHQMELSELLRLNKLTPRSTIFPGQILLVKVR